MVVVGEVAIIVAVVGWFVSPHITRLMEVARSCAANSKYKLPRGIKKKLYQLAADLGDIKCFLGPASMGFVNDSAWLERLWRLKDAIHDAEEILDLFELQILEAQAANNLKGKMMKKKKLKRYGGSASTIKGSLDELVKVLGNLRENARELQQDPNRLVHVHGVVSHMLARAETGPVPVRLKSSFFGYHKEYTQLVSMLVQQHGDKDTMSKAQQIIAIVGHGGMGKTELARQAFRDVKGKFDLQIWVHAYGKQTEFDLLKEIWKSVAGDRPVGEMNLACLQRELEKLLASKMCLLVIDDVWNHELASSKQDSTKQAAAALDSFMRFVREGSRILITTRAKICSTTLSAGATIVLDGIKPNEMIALLLDDTAKLGTDDDDPRIKELLNEQLTKLKGSPLAAIEIGEELKKQAGSHRRCSNILADMENHMGSVFSAHFFTYHHLPPHLQRCFAFCSIFPYKWRFQPEKLARMWIAHGFVEEDNHCPPACGTRSMEDLARGYFDSLVDRSLFQVEEACSMDTKTDQGSKQTYYVIHEQIHWMLRLASANNCICFSGATSHSATKNIPPRVRHLSVTRGCLEKLKAHPSITLANLRTLLVLKDSSDDDNSSSAIDKDILGHFKGVRVLDMTETGITELPGSIGKLKHVRYLGLPSTITGLCDEVTRLLFLQTLSVGDKRNKAKNCLLQMFPKDMNSLINVRHLDIDTECIANISGIGRLVKLQGSIEFKVIKGSEKEGHSMSELAGMNSLGGTLTIKGLDAVASKEEAEEARLVCKGSVKVLKLQWGPQDGRPAAADLAVAVLEGLQPHSDLRDLRITRYPGATSPRWLTGLEMLTRLYLRNCRKLQALPAVGALPCLEVLDIKELTSIERIDAGICAGGGLFPKLKKILLEDMPVLVAWCDMPKLAFPHLTEVSVLDCPLLTSLSGLECCTCAIDMRVKGCPAITPHTLPASFGTGASVCRFQ